MGAEIAQRRAGKVRIRIGWRGVVAIAARSAFQTIPVLVDQRVQAKYFKGKAGPRF